MIRGDWTFGLLLTASVLVGCDSAMPTLPNVAGQGGTAPEQEAQDFAGSSSQGGSGGAGSTGDAGAQGLAGSGGDPVGAGGSGAADSGVGGSPAHVSVQLVAGDDHFCSRGDDGRVLCWGESNELASGRRDVGLSQVAYLASGPNVTCASDSLWHVYCWGGSVSSGAPVQYGALQAGRELMVNDNAICALDMNQDVLCWGAQVDGTVQASPVLVPRPAGEIRKLHANHGTFSVLFADGYLWAPRNWSIEREIPYGLETQDVAVSSGRECRLSSSGTVWCTPEGRNHFTRVGLQELDLVQLSANERQVCGLSAAGQVYCNNHETQGTGNGTHTNPASWALTYGLPLAVDLVAGGSYGCIRDAQGGIWCFGSVPGFGDSFAIQIEGTGGGMLPSTLAPRIPVTTIGELAEATVWRGTSLCECADSTTPFGELGSCIREEGARYNFRCLRSLEANPEAMSWASCKSDTLNVDSSCWVNHCNEPCPETAASCAEPLEPFTAPCDRHFVCPIADIEITPDLLCDGESICDADEANCAP